MWVEKKGERRGEMGIDSKEVQRGLEWVTGAILTFLSGEWILKTPRSSVSGGLPLIYKCMTCVRTTEAVFWFGLPISDSSLSDDGDLTTSEIGSLPSDRWEWGQASQGPDKSKKYVYWGQCSQLGHRGSCLCWPNANKPVARRMTFLTMTGSHTPFHFHE